MDIIHHTLMGGVGFAMLAAADQELAGAVFVAASVFPDLDVFFMLLGKQFYLKCHQGPTHSFLLSPLFALIICSPVFCLIEFCWPVLTAALLGLWIHIFLDYSNTFGIALFWPVSSERFCLDSVFFIDIVCWGLTSAAIFAIYIDQPLVAGIVYFCLFAVYSVLKSALHKRVKNDTACKTAIPSSINPFEFYILKINKGSAETGMYNALTKRYSKIKIFKQVHGKYLDMAEKSKVYKAMKHITKSLFITDILTENNEITIIAQDLAVRNFGGKFGRTTLRFTTGGELIHEMADI